MAGRYSRLNKLNKDRIVKFFRRYNLQEVSRESGLSVNTLYCIKNNEDITGMVAYKLAKAIGISLEELIEVFYDLDTTRN